MPEPVWLENVPPLNVERTRCNVKNGSSNRDGYSLRGFILCVFCTAVVLPQRKVLFNKRSRLMVLGVILKNYHCNVTSSAD